MTTRKHRFIIMMSLIARNWYRRYTSMRVSVRIMARVLSPRQKYRKIQYELHSDMLSNKYP